MTIPEIEGLAKQHGLTLRHNKDGGQLLMGNVVQKQGGQVLFVGTKKQAQEVTREVAQNTKQPFVVSRWLGGTLTNFRTIKQGLDRLRALERMQEDGTYLQLPKKEVVRLEKERARALVAVRDAAEVVGRAQLARGHAAERDRRRR